MNDNYTIFCISYATQQNDTQRALMLEIILTHTYEMHIHIYRKESKKRLQVELLNTQLIN